jgi:predicted dehydrogenase
MGKRWGIAVVGAGMGMRPHGQSLRDLERRADVIGVYSRTEARRREAANAFGWQPADDLDALIGNPRVDAVLVLTPPNAHLDVARRAAALGKHILVEKPLEVTTAGSERLVDAAREARVKLGVVLHYRTRAAARRLDTLVRSNALGALVTASVSVRWWRNQAYYDEAGRGTLARDGGGVLLTQAIHALNLFQSIAGPISEVTAFAATSRAHRMECEDVACAALRFRNGAIGSLDTSTASYPGFPERWEWVFENATALLVGEDLSVFNRDGSVEQVRGGGTDHGGGADPMAYSHVHHRAVIEDFLDALDEDRDPIVTGADALRTHDLIEALLASNSTGRPTAPRQRDDPLAER